MNFLEAILLGIIEGLTEFLPVSSTAHLIIASKLLNIQSTDFIKFFEIFIQSGAILAILFLYFEKFFSNKKIILFILISFTVTSLIAIIFYKIIKNIFFEKIELIIFNLFLLGVLFIITEEFIKRKKIQLKRTLEDLSVKESILIGFFQALSIMPGISRAGAVILGMIVLGYKRQETVLYSFLLSVPTIIFAGLFDFYKTGLNQIYLSNQNLFYLITGFITSFLSALLVVKWFINYLKKNDLKIFGYYRIILAIILYFLFF